MLIWHTGIFMQVMHYITITEVHYTPLLQKNVVITIHYNYRIPQLPIDITLGLLIVLLYYMYNSTYHDTIYLIVIWTSIYLFKTGK